MTFKDWTQLLWDKVKTGGGFGQEGVMEANMPHGGSCGYRPATARHRALHETARQQAPEAMAPDMTGAMNWEQPGAFTGFQPQMTGFQPPMDANQTGYQQPMNGWTQQQHAYDPGYGYQAGAFQPQGMNATGYVQPQGNQIPNNISYMPNSFAGDDRQGYRHVERVAVVTTVSACYRLIEFMRNSESVIVNTEQISDAAENQRCLDLLYGAAYTMGCSFTRIAGKSIYLIAPACVMVKPYESIGRMSEQDLSQRWPSDDNAWDAPRRDERHGFTRSHPSYAAPRGWQDDHAGFGGYRAVGYNR